MPQYTWKAEGFTVVDSHGDLIALADIHWLPQSQRASNTRLMAAAPDLLAVCQEYLALCRAYLSEGSQVGSLHQRAEAAVAKALAPPS